MSWVCGVREFKMSNRLLEPNINEFEFDPYIIGLN